MPDNEVGERVLEAGAEFRGYVVDRLLGRGGAGAVYLVRHQMLNMQYALKVLHAGEAAKDETTVKRFLREARLATRIRHPNLVAVHDCGFDAGLGVYYIVMDYVEGSSLRDIIAFKGKLDLAWAADVVAQVAMALQATQAFHVVHRDIKPENIMVQPDGLVKLLDLGIAKADNLGDSLRTMTDRRFGTPAYVSPEQASNSADVDVRADIYSLGVVFFEMLTGKCPYTGRNPAEIVRQLMSETAVPDIRDLDRDQDEKTAVLVRRMMEKDRDRRLRTFEELLSGLKALDVELKHAALPESAQVQRPPTRGMKTLLNGLDDIPQDGGGEDFMDDPDVRSLMRRKRMRRLLNILVPALLSLLALAMILAYCV